MQFRCSVETFAAARNLKWFHASAGGSDGCLEIPAVARGEVLLTDSRKVKNTKLSEMAMGDVFALARSIDVGLANQRRQEPQKRLLAVLPPWPRRCSTQDKLRAVP